MQRQCVRKVIRGHLARLGVNDRNVYDRDTLDKLMRMMNQLKDEMQAGPEMLLDCLTEQIKTVPNNLFRTSRLRERDAATATRVRSTQPRNAD